jgi:hypothetical protein
MADVRMYAKPNVDILLVGNKADLEAKREVDFKRAKVTNLSFYLTWPIQNGHQREWLK